MVDEDHPEAQAQCERGDELKWGKERKAEHVHDGLLCSRLVPGNPVRLIDHSRLSGKNFECLTGFPIVTTPRPPDDALRKDSFRELVEPEIEVLLRVAMTITSNQDESEDLVQETLLRAYRALDRFDGRHPRAWLLTILRNTNANMHRRRRPGTIGDWELIRAAQPAFGRAELPSAEDSFVHEELHLDLDAAVRALDPRFRAALILVDVHDLSYSEAAAVMGVPVGTVM
ncbi:MAG: sigma-70 family RNA polymerase sigma factor, partial [Nocardioides sp.]